MLDALIVLAAVLILLDIALAGRPFDDEDGEKEEWPWER